MKVNECHVMSNKVELKPVTRTLSHLRNIDCRGYLRSDGKWDIEATLVDTKGITLRTPDRPYIGVGEKLHEMKLCVTIDTDMLIHDVHASMDSTPYASCPEVVQNYQQLIGVTIGGGWQKTIRQLFGGVKGCTHLRELLGPIATVAYQTIIDAKYRQEDYRKNPQVFRNIMNDCYGLREDGPTAPVLWPEFFKS